MAITKEDFADAVVRHQKKLHGFIASKVQNVHEVDDMLQETLLDAYKDIESLKNSDKLLPWLQTIAFNNIKDHSKRKRRLVFSDLTDKLTESRESIQKNLLQEFDLMVQKLIGPEVSDDMLLLTTLYFCMNWSGKKIASVLGMDRQKVYRLIRKTKSRVETSEAGRKTLDPAKDRRMKLKLIRFFINASFNPPDGVAYRNSHYLREGQALGRLMAVQYPDDPEVIYNSFRVTATLAVQSEFPNDLTEPSGFARTKRQLFDPELLREADTYFQRLMILPLDPEMRCMAQYYHHMAFVKRNEDLDWKKLLDLSLEAVKVHPQANRFFMVAFTIGNMEGPLRAAAYLETVKRNSWLRDNPLTYKAMGGYYYNGKNWKNARINIKKYLGWPTSRIHREDAEEYIKICTDNIKLSSKKKK